MDLTDSGKFAAMRFRGHGLLRWCIGAFLCLNLQLAAKAQRVSFPGKASEVKSPNGRYTVRNTDDQNRTPAHLLTLIDNRNGVAIISYSYSRHVDVLWSPTSKAFVVNDYEGSETSRPLLFTEPWVDQPLDLRERLTDLLCQRGDAKSILGNHHVFVVAEKWRGGGEIVCRATGYGDVDRKGFKKVFVYKLRGGFRSAQ